MTREQLNQRAKQNKFVVASHIRDDYFTLLYLGEARSGVNDAVSKTAKPLILKYGEEIRL